MIRKILFLFLIGIANGLFFILMVFYFREEPFFSFLLGFVFYSTILYWFIKKGIKTFPSQLNSYKKTLRFSILNVIYISLITIIVVLFALLLNKSGAIQTKLIDEARTVGPYINLSLVIFILYFISGVVISLFLSFLGIKNNNK
jgi:hypothetical protein